MGGRWIAYGTQLSCFILLVVVFEIHGCWSLNSEGSALLQFGAKVDFDPFGALANWNPNDCDPCMWSGIDCVDGKAHTIDLNGRALEGALAPELGNLTHLRFLHLSKNHFFGSIPPQFGQLTKLEVLDLRDNNLTGIIPAELGGLHSLKLLLLCNNSFDGNFPMEIGKLSLLTSLHLDEILTTTSDEIHCVNRKFGNCIWQNVLTQSKKLDSFKRPIKGTIIHYLNLFPLFKSGSESSDVHTDNSSTNLTDSSEQDVIQDVNYQVNNVRRMLAEQSSNLAAIPPNSGPPSASDTVNALPSRSSGSFPAIPNAKILSPTPSPLPTPAPSPSTTLEHKHHRQTTDKRSPADAKFVNRLKLIIGILIAAFLLIIVAVVFLIFRRRAAKTGPWVSGLSGQLQKAFITGVPKLDRGELETACEDFSNIIITYDGVVTVYKGTLSNGVEIVVASTVIDSLEDWSKHSELAYRNEIDSLSRVNHKNFVNLIGFCEEEEPFTRMMVFEYAPNGTLFEHLHVKEAEHLDWNARMRIIMGTAFCLQYMHDLNPPVVHYDLNSKEILLTDDFAAKIADIGFWAELITKSKQTAETESELSELPSLASTEANVLSFGILMLELISGKQTYTEKQGHLINWAAQYLNDKRTINCLKDPILETFEKNELEVVCEVIGWCIQQDAQKRPTMREVIQKLRQAIDISPEAATPRLSPLWWAELEVLSAEAA